MERTPLGPTRALARFVAETRADDLPRPVLDRTRVCLLDWIGSACAGVGDRSGRAVGEVLRSVGGRGASTLVGSREPASATDAALYNGVVSAVMEVDDVHEECSLHPGIGVIPAALATAEHVGASGKALLAAIAVGYELSVRVARAAGSSHYRFWHTTATCNTFGAAAAAAHLLHLDAERATMALGLAGTQAAGLWESLNGPATMAKHLHSGRAASSGVLAALFAAAGVQGSATILEGEKGFLAAASAGPAEDRRFLTEGLGSDYRILHNFFKRHACCRAAFEGIEGIQAYVQAGGRIERIAKIVVTMRPARTWLVAVRNPANIYEAKFSLPFCMAIAALKGGAGLLQFSEQHLQDAAVRRFMENVHLLDDPTLTCKARIEVADDGGGIWAGEPLCSSPDHHEVRAKFIANLSARLGVDWIARTEAAVGRLEQAETLAELSACLREGARRSAIA